MPAMAKQERVNEKTKRTRAARSSNSYCVRNSYMHRNVVNKRMSWVVTDKNMKQAIMMPTKSECIDTLERTTIKSWVLLKDEGWRAMTLKEFEERVTSTHE